MKMHILTIFLFVLLTGCATTPIKRGVEGNTYISEKSPPARVEVSSEYTYASNHPEALKHKAELFINPKTDDSVFIKIYSGNYTAERTFENKMMYEKFQQKVDGLLFYVGTNVEQVEGESYFRKTHIHYPNSNNMFIIMETFPLRAYGSSYEWDTTYSWYSNEQKTILKTLTQRADESIKITKNHTIATASSKSDGRYLHIIHPMVDVVTSQLTFENQKACKAYVAIISAEVDESLKDAFSCSDDSVSSDLKYIATLKFKGFNKKIIVETLYFSECDEFISNTQEDVFDITQDCSLKDSSDDHAPLTAFWDEMLESQIYRSNALNKSLRIPNDIKGDVEKFIENYDTNSSGNKTLLGILKDRGFDVGSKDVRPALIQAAKDVLVRRDIDPSDIK